MKSQAVQKTLYTLEISSCFIKGQGLALCSPTLTHRGPPSSLPHPLGTSHLHFFRSPETAEPVAASGPLH